MCNRRAHIGPWDRPQDVVGAPDADMLCYPGRAFYRPARQSLCLRPLPGSMRATGGSWCFRPTRPLRDSNSAIFAPAAAKVFTDLGAVEERFFANIWEPRQAVEIGRVYLRSRQTATWEPAFDSTNRMVVGYNSYMAPRFVGYYDDPLGSSTTPTGFLNDLGSMPYAATFDENDNLYVADLNRNRVLIYWNPFNNPQ